MSLTKQVVVDQIEIIESGSVQVRTTTRIIEDGNIISSSLNYHTISPGDNYGSENSRVQAVCAAVHTVELVASYKANKGD
jgi:hypothetical protein